MKKSNRVKKTWIIVIVVIVALVILQTLPIFFPKPLGSKVLMNENIHLYYQPGEAHGALEVFTLLQTKVNEIRSQMDDESDVPTNVYLYGSQNALAIREAGFVTLLFAPSWYIGDSHNGSIMMVSPDTKVKGHTHDTILQATLHELVHSIVFRVNPNLSYFWDNGLATYLAGQLPEEDIIRSMSVPTMSDMHTENGLTFGNMGGYAFSYKYIEYLDNTYGWDKVMAYASGKGTYEDVFQMSEEDIHEAWCLYLAESSQ